MNEKMSLASLYSYLKKDLNYIEVELEKTIEAQHPILQVASNRLLKAGGKRIRPVFVLLAAKFGNYDLDEIKKAAVPLELIHMASLVHDDVIDDASLRRGQKTVKEQWDNRVAMYTGDYILARALEYISQLNKPNAHQVLSKAMVEMSIGEIEQIKDQFNLDQTIRNYFLRIKRKTALLISVSCELGAIAADVPKKEVILLRRYGHYVGMMYQITDDILDLTGTEKQLGKPAGGDLKQGNITLPVLLAMKDKEIYAMINNYFDGNLENEDMLLEIIEVIKKNHAIEKAQEVSNQYLNKALKIMEDLPNIKARKSLLQIADYIGTRNF
jgi:heptaprenyl diphosphate synthase